MYEATGVLLADVDDVFIAAIAVLLLSHVLTLWRTWSHVERTARREEARHQALLDLVERTLERASPSPITEMHSAERLARGKPQSGTGARMGVPPAEPLPFDVEETPPDRVEYSISR